MARHSFFCLDGHTCGNPVRLVLDRPDKLPFVTSIYKRDLEMEKYFIGYLKHPYISFYSGRGCKSRCTFCLWPQTVGGHTYRTRSVAHVIEEIKYCLKEFPQTKEFFFDDDTFTDNLPRAEEIARELGKLGVTWSCNAKANVPRETLKVLKDNGLRLLLVVLALALWQVTSLYAPAFVLPSPARVWNAWTGLLASGSFATDLGITLALIPTDHPGVEIGRRHYPARQAFQ